MRNHCFPIVTLLLVAAFGPSACNDGSSTNPASGSSSSSSGDGGMAGHGGSGGGHGGSGGGHGGSGGGSPGAFTLDMMPIPGGTFQMGSTRADNEQPIHSVTLSPFVMSAHEITIAQFRTVMGHDPSMFPGDDLPVGHVSFYDAITFANELSKKAGLDPAYSFDPASAVPDTPVIIWNQNANGFRLPTEAEWEYAARGGTTTDTYEGDVAVPAFTCANDAVVDPLAWYCKNSPDGGMPVGQKKPNAYGLHDMLGNVWEWVWDWEPQFNPAPYDPGAVTNPTGKNGNGPGSRVLRGGSWFWPPVQSRVASRIAHVVNAKYSHVDFGFRLAGPPSLEGKRSFSFDPVEIVHPSPVVPDSKPPEMVQVPAGTFEMGPEAGPTRTVTLSSFFVTKTEITQALWASVMQKNPSHEVGADLPVHGIGWYDIATFANELSKRDGFEPAYDIRADVEDRPGATPMPEKVTWIAGANGYRMLTEAEWEYAARGGTTTSVYTGNRMLPVDQCGPDAALEAAGWYCYNAGNKPHPVGQKVANAYGIQDMIGNVSEWVWDWFSPLSGDNLTNPTGPATPMAGRFRVLRGGSWLGAPMLHRSSARGPHIVNQFYGHTDYGIRLARSAP